MKWLNVATAGNTVWQRDRRRERERCKDSCNFSLPSKHTEHMKQNNQVKTVLPVLWEILAVRVLCRRPSVTLDGRPVWGVMLTPDRLPTIAGPPGFCTHTDSFCSQRPPCCSSFAVLFICRAPPWLETVLLHTRQGHRCNRMHSELLYRYSARVLRGLKCSNFNPKVSLGWLDSLLSEI